MLTRLAYNLSRHLTRLEVSQKKASDLAGEHPMAAHRVVNGVNMPRVGGLVRICMALGINVNDLLKPVPKKSSQAA